MTITHTGIKRLLTKLNTKITTLLNGKANSNHTHQVFITNPFNLTPNTETSLGDGTYIQRFTGSFNHTSASTHTTLNLSTTLNKSTCRMVETGGWATPASSSHAHVVSVGTCVPSALFFNLTITATNPGLCIQLFTTITGSHNYDVWMRYIKI